MNKTVKRIIALGTGAAMLGATVLGAMAAADLSAYPKPFVDNGKFNGLVVVGANAIGTDTLGAADILASLQAANTVTETISGTTETVVEGGVKIETSASKLFYEDTLKDIKETFTKTEFPTLLKQAVITDDEGAEYKYDTLIRNPDGLYPTFGTPGDLESPILYLEDPTAPITIEINFNKEINFSTVRGKEFEILGKKYTISDSTTEVTADKLTLYSTALDQTFTAGTAATTVTVGGKDITVEVIGVKTGGDTGATIKVNGETKQVETGHSYTIGGEKIYVKDIMAYDQPVGGGAVRLFVGSDKIELEDSTIVKKITSTGSVDIDGVEYTGDADFEALSQMKFTITPSNFDPEVEYVTDELVEPLFGAFKYQFTGATPAFGSTDRGTIKIQPDGTTKVKIAFTDRDGNAVSVSPIKYSTVFDYKIGTETLHITDENIAVDDYFIMNVDGYSYILQLKKIDTTPDEVTLKNVVTGESLVKTYSGQLVTYSFHGVEVTFNVTTVLNLDDVDADIEPVFYTKDGASITMGLLNSSNVSGKDSAVITVGEADASWISYSTAALAADATVATTWTYDEDDTKVISSKPGVAAEQFGDTNKYAGVTGFGTYVTHDTDSDITELKYYYEITSYGVYLAPTGATTTTTGGDTYQRVVPIAVGAAVLDTEVTDYTAQNLIVVGGPCANSVAATLMGNPADCAAGFEQGKAIIKLYEQNGHVAILVAGYSGMDTRRASRVLAQYSKYALSGTEMVVVGTSLTDITVSIPTTV